MSLVHINFESQYSNGNTDVNIILPDKPRTTNPDDFYANHSELQSYSIVCNIKRTVDDARPCVSCEN